MGRTVRITSGDVPRALRDVGKLNVKTTANRSDTWIPEDQTNLGSITVRESGTYSPESDDVYGYEKVNVMVAGGGTATIEVEENGVVVWKTIDPGPSVEAGSSVFGVDRSDGNTYYVKVDDEGILRKTKIPSKARLDSPPWNLDYSDGDRVSYGGVSVSLYYGDGTKATDWDNGRISHGTEAWDTHVLEMDEELSFGDSEQAEVTCYVLPFWFDRWATIGEDYGLPFKFAVRRA